MDYFFFLVFATIAVVSAVNVVVQRHPIASALSLIGVMGSIAVLYLSLGAEFIAMAQIIVYAGAVMVLFIFVIMLLNAGAEERRGRSWTAQLLGAPVLIAFLGMLCSSSSASSRTRASRSSATSPAVRRRGRLALFTDYLLPFEVTSILILIAILGAIVLARKEMD